MRGFGLEGSPLASCIRIQFFFDGDGHHHSADDDHCSHCERLRQQADAHQRWHRDRIRGSYRALLLGVLEPDPRGVERMIAPRYQLIPWLKGLLDNTLAIIQPGIDCCALEVGEPRLMGR